MESHRLTHPGFARRAVYRVTSLSAVQMIPFGVGSGVDVLQTVHVHQRPIV